MKTFSRMICVAVLVATSAALACGQETVTTTQDTAASLRLQLIEVQTKEADLREREKQLDEALQPENIARSILGVGTTRPEEVREQRRRQLESERARVRAELASLAQSRTRLEAAIAKADAEAYRRSAQLNYTVTQTAPATTPEANKAAPPKKQRRAQRRRRARRN